MKLRTLFLAPSAVLMLSLFFLPLLIVLAYSFLSRGPYGGVMLPWSIESYTRIFDPLYFAFLAFHLDCGSVNISLPAAGLSSGSLYCARRFAQDAAAEFGDAAILDKLPHPHLRLDVFAARHRVGEYRAAITTHHSRTATAFVQYGRGDSWSGLWIFAIHGAAALRNFRKARSGLARCRGRSWRIAGGRAVASGGAHEPSRHDGWLLARIHSLLGRISYAGSHGRRENSDDRQFGAEPIHHRARLAFWRGRFAAAHGHGSACNARAWR